MSTQFPALNEKFVKFIGEQKIFFVGTATADSRVNISPKGMDSFRIINNNRVLWLSVTGSGNETAAHVQICPHMTIMFCAFEGQPMTLRLYGKARVIHTTDADWPDLFSRFEPLPGARQIFELDIDLVQISCGMSIPYLQYSGEREHLKRWAVKKGPAGLRRYWKERNEFTIDNIPTNMHKFVPPEPDEDE